MTGYKVRFLPDDIAVEVEEGANLLQTAMLAGVHINASCGGSGVCGKCRVIIESGELDAPRTEHITEQEYESGYRQACRAEVRGDVVIRVPVESQMDSRALNRPRAGVNAARAAKEITVDALKEEDRFNPPFVKKLVMVNPPSSGDNISDLDRVVRYLRHQLDVHGLEVDFKAIQSLPVILREGDFTVSTSLAYPPSYGREGGSTRIALTDFQAGDHTDKNYGLAIDLGTTTIFVQLVDLVTGEVLDTMGDFNRQLSYGEDVINRIIFAGKTMDSKKCRNWWSRPSTG